MVIVPVSGLLTVYVNLDIGEIHQLAKPVYIVLIAFMPALRYSTISSCATARSSACLRSMQTQSEASDE